jgi:hypothetical protein
VRSKVQCRTLRLTPRRATQALVAIWIVGSVLISGCATEEPHAFVGDGVASNVIVTPAHTVPGKNLIPLGIVYIDPGQPSMFNRFGESCKNPLNLAKAALNKYSHVDAIVDFHSESGQCTPGLSGAGICSTTCGGTAVVFVDAPASPNSKSAAGSANGKGTSVRSASNVNTDWPESEFGSY